MCVCMYVYYVHPGVGVAIGGLPFSFGKGSGGRFRGGRKAAPREQGSVRVLEIGRGDGNLRLHRADRARAR